MKSLILIFILAVALVGCRTRTRYDTIFEAIAASDVKDVRAHLRKGVPIESGAAAGMTPLRAALITQQPEIMRLLLKHKANVNFCPSRSTTLMHDAAATGDTMVAQTLVSAGLSADAHLPGQGNALSCDPLPSLIMTYWLLRHGADPNGAECHPFSPLHLAAWYNQPGIFMLLFRTGADPAVRDGVIHCPADSFACWRCPLCLVVLGKDSLSCPKQESFDNLPSASETISDIETRIATGEINLWQARKESQDHLKLLQRQLAYIKSNQYGVELYFETAAELAAATEQKSSPPSADPVH